MYHSFSTEAAPAFRRFALPPQRFRAHLDHLSGAGYTTHTYAQLVSAFAAGTTLPGRPVVITVDDGFRDFATVALPALTERGMTATLFVTSGCTGSTARFLARDGEGERPMLGWGELAAAADAGIEIGAHTLTHPELDRVRGAKLRTELAAPKAMLEQRLHVPVRSLAYPYGYYSRKVRDAAEDAGYDSACTVLDLVCEPGDDLFALTRLTVADTTDVRALDRLLTSAPGRHDLARAHAKRLVWRQVRRVGAVRPVMAGLRALRDARSARPASPEGQPQSSCSRSAP
jgi:peptidoglycan/xylan/chitin deacetylase (PgdA/CDA1 family)